MSALFKSCQSLLNTSLSILSRPVNVSNFVMQRVCASSFVKPFIPKPLAGTMPRYAENTLSQLPRDVERMMQKVLPRIAQNKRVHKMLLTKRSKKHSYEAKMETARGRFLIHRKLVNRDFPLWQYEN